MSQFWTGFAVRWVVAFLVLLGMGLIHGPTAAEAAVIAVVTAFAAHLSDKLFPFGVQGWVRWAIDSAVATLVIYLSQWLWPGIGLPFRTAIFAGMVIGAIEIPIHFFLASRFGIKNREDDRDGIK